MSRLIKITRRSAAASILFLTFFFRLFYFFLFLTAERIYIRLVNIRAEINLTLIAEILEEKKKKIIIYKSAVGRLSTQLCRRNSVAFWGIEKKKINVVEKEAAAADKHRFIYNTCFAL